ncbi:acid phosphatase [Moniliophthora roreri]|nr:acid phosphatase [Moniliophthora roreri]
MVEKRLRKIVGLRVRELVTRRDSTRPRHPCLRLSAPSLWRDETFDDASSYRKAKSFNLAEAFLRHSKITSNMRKGPQI